MFNLEIFRSKDSLLLLEKEKPEIVPLSLIHISEPTRH